MVNSARSIINFIVKFLIHAKAPGRKASELTSRVNSKASGLPLRVKFGLELGLIGFATLDIGPKLALFGFELGLYWVCFYAPPSG